MVDLLRAGRHVALLADGPRGPARVAKAGSVALARLCNQKIHPIALSAAPSLRFGSWDRSLLPLPFARVLCEFGEPLAASADARSNDRDADARALTVALEALSQTLDGDLRLR